MSRATAIRANYEDERAVAFGSVTAAYTLVGALFTHPIRALYLDNQTNTAIQISLDGSRTFKTLAPGGTFALDVTANKTDDGGFFLPINWGIYVRYVTAPASGSFYSTAIYGDAPSLV